MTKTTTQENKEFQVSGRSGLYLPTNLRKQVDPTLVERTWEKARTPILVGTALITLGTSALPFRSAYADNITIENTVKGDENNAFGTDKTRIKAGVGPTIITYDLNNKGNPDEAKLWVDALDKNGWYAGVLVEGSTNDGKNSYADIGACVSKTLGGKTIEAFVGPTVQPGVTPFVFYQLAVRDTTGNSNLVVAVVDDRGIPFGTNNLDLRTYVSAQKGNGFGGVGFNLSQEEITKIYGAGGLKIENVGTGGVFNYDSQNQKGFFKVMGGLGNPSGVFNIGDIVNLWNDIQGPGMRNVGQPKFSSFLTKGNLTGKVEGTINAHMTDVEAMIGKDLGLFRLGLGINCHNESGVKYGGLIHVAKSVSLGELGNFYFEGRHNTRNDNTQLYAKLSRDF